jgi:hypothetical protein
MASSHDPMGGHRFSEKIVLGQQSAQTTKCSDNKAVAAFRTRLKKNKFCACRYRR